MNCLNTANEPQYRQAAWLPFENTFPLFKKNYGTLHLALCHCAHCLPLYFLGIQRADSWKPKKTERKWYCILVVWSVPSCHLKCVFKKICSNVIFHNVVKTLKFTGKTLGVGDGQGGLMCYNPWGHKESDTTEWLNWTEYT